MELMTAHKQWANRPADQRVASLKELFQRTQAIYKASAQKEVPFEQLRVQVVKEDVCLSGKEGRVAQLTNWAFGQLCAKVGAPASYLEELPATLAVQNLNYGLAQRTKNAVGREMSNLLLYKNSHWLVRAITTDIYERFWNYELAERLLDLEAKGWEPARPDFNKQHDDFPALYLSDRDMFAFIRMQNCTLDQPVKQGYGQTAPIYKGLIYWNSEVGGKKIGAMKFLYNGMCGNHIIWGASDVQEFSAKHVGDLRGKVKAFAVEIKKFADESMNEDAAVLKLAARKLIASTKEELLDKLFGKRSLQLSYKTLEAGFNAVRPDQDGDPKTVWGMVQGLTRYSQTIPYTDKRTQIDRGAGRLLEMTASF